MKRQSGPMPPRSAQNLAGGILLLYGLLSLSGTSIEPDSRKIDPLLLHSDAASIRHAQKKSLGAALDPTLAVPVFLRTDSDDPALADRIRNLGGTAKRISSTVHTAQLPMDGLRYASNWPSVSYIEGARRVRPVLDRSRPAVFADDVQAGTGLPGGVGFTGQGILVGIVDTGMDGSHPDFNAGAPPASRVVHTFSFSGGVSALSDTDGHGTHVTGIAAGNGTASSGLYTGMAPQAGIMVGRAGVSSFFTTDIINGVADLFGYAENVAAKPAAINLSLGGMDGPHDGTSSFEAAVNSLATGAAGSRRLVAVAAGNEQNLNEHFRGVAPAFGSATASLTLRQDPFSGTAVVDIWADGEDRFTVTAVRGAESIVAASGSLVSDAAGTISIANRTAIPPNQATHIQVFYSRPSASNLSASIRFDRVRNGGSGKVDAYMDISDGNFTAGSASLVGTTIEPANGDNVIAVGSFQTKISGGGAGSLAISSFSSIGPTRDGRVKPDVAAPGEIIYSARSSQGSFDSSEIVPGNSSYVIMAGTSMATPHVTGIAAQVWESNPGLTGAQMRERLRRTADPVGPSPNTTWGFGKVDVLRAVRESVAAITAPATAVPGVPVALSSENSSAAFTGNSLSYAWSLVGKPAGSNTPLSASTPGASFTPDLPGDYTVRLSVSQASPADTPTGVSTTVIHANHLPTAGFSVPSSGSAGQSVTFRGTASDGDNPPLGFHWVLVSRPAGSAASITAANVDNAVFTPDAEGAYEIGLRADDGLDNSALAVHSYTTLNSTLASSSSGGGGGCLSITRSGGEAPFGSSLFSVGILLLPACALGLRRVFRGREEPVPARHPLC